MLVSNLYNVGIAYLLLILTFKPWNAEAPSRHALEDDYDTKEGPIPEITIESLDVLVDYFVLFSKNTEVLLSSLEEGKKIGKVEISYPQLEDHESEFDIDNEDYDEYNQMYLAAHMKALNYPKVTIDIIKFDNFATVQVPHFKNVITNHILARALINNFDSKVKKNWITVCPGSLNYKCTICKLLINSNFSSLQAMKTIPKLEPPHFVTGTAASLISKLSQLSNSKCISLVLNSEGPIGFEKIDGDALIDAGYTLAQICQISSSAYLKKLSSSVRKINGYSNSSMYI
ncbi:LOW QUALITY PROTEIN: uncharacterized protein PRCAT00001097001 [Priceomyces carsonii]|uniref:uncharacterized protein n=1 Tax=Priceomyces carsonii TaxID=28549 RepID=UPI002ED97345|nr:unnamed protein product [Priceomyces carsonii]